MKEYLSPMERSILIESMLTAVNRESCASRSATGKQIKLGFLRQCFSSPAQPGATERKEKGRQTGETRGSDVFARLRRGESTRHVSRALRQGE